MPENSPPLLSAPALWPHLRRGAIVLGVVAVLAIMAMRYVYPAYRDHAWRSNAFAGMILLKLHRDEIERIHGDAAVRITPRDVPAAGAILGGYYAADGSAVVRVRLDYPLVHHDATLTIVLRRWVNLLTGRAQWDCGLTPDSYRFNLSKTCQATLDAPPRD